MKHLRTAGLLALLGGALLLATPTQALPPGFVETPVAGGWNEVCGLAFSADGTRLYAVERGGKVWIVENGVKQATPFLDISDEVGAWADFGMLGFALHPNFEQNGYVYALYVVDRYYLFHHGQPDYDPALLESQQYQATIGRLSRFTADPATGRTTIIPGSEKILIGATAEDGIPMLYQSHGTGQIVFGDDGTLLVSTGDGASFNTTDTGSDPQGYFAQALIDHIIEPWENVGAWRSQQVDSLNGKILRIDPATGNGALGNPWFDPTQPASARSRVFALGLRNPYRFTLRPESGSHDPADGEPGTFYIGDVGWSDAESLHILKQGGQNFGWPAFEGLNQRATSTTASTYWNAGTPDPRAPNPLASQPGCSYPFLRFRDLIVQESQNPPSWPNPCNESVQIPDQWLDPSDGMLYHYDKFVHSRPPISWRNDAWVATFDGSGNASYETMGTPQSPVPGPNFTGNTSTGGAWYTGTDFPPEWQNTYFHGDYGTGWILNFRFDANDQLTNVVDFLSPGHSVTFVATNPVTGGIYYVNWGDTVSEVRWVGTGNTPPKAVAEPAVSWNTGSELTVQFTGSNSSDPDPGAVLSYVWDFGDGSAPSTQPDPQHTFTTAGTLPVTFPVSLTVTDEDGHADIAQAHVSLNDSPPSVELTSPVDGGLYSMAEATIVPVRSSISDAEQAPGSLTCSLLVELVHNNHVHPDPPIAACEADVQITPAGCDGNTYHWRFTLTVTDPEGLSATDSASLAPDCSTVPNQPPLAQPDAAAVFPGSYVVVDVLANDVDYDGALVPSTVRIESPPSSGTAWVNPVSGAVTYTHGGSSPGDAFSYTVADDDGTRSSLATVSIIALSTEGLVAAYGFDEEGGTSVVDASGQGNTGSLIGVTRTPSGRYGNGLVFAGSGSLVAIPDSSSLDLSAAMTLEAWVYPTELNNSGDVIYKGAGLYYLNAFSPQGNVPTTGGTFCASPLYSTGGALRLDTWSHLAATYDGSSLRLYVNGVKVTSRAESGSIETSTDPLTLGGDLISGQNFVGRIDEVRVYSRALSAIEIQGDMATPVSGPPANQPPVAVDDGATLAEGASTPIDLAANDTDAEGLLDPTSIAIVSSPANGSVAVNGDGSVTYTHDGSETTSDAFTYTIRDAAAVVSNVATVSLAVTPVNDAPTALGDSAALLEAGSVAIDLAANDTDAEGALDPTSIAIVSSPANGSVAVNGDGSVTYTHDGSETTSDAFTYTIRDAAAAVSNVATVSLAVTPSNDAPTALGDSAALLEAGSVAIDLAANDTDAEGALDPTSIAIVSSPTHGSVVVNGDGSVTYTHDGSNTTSDAFTYRIRDLSGALSNVATVSLTITPDGFPEVPAMNLFGLGALAAGLLSTGLARLTRQRSRAR